MEGLWLVSYIALWLFVSLQSLLLISLLRHIGNLRVWLKQSGIILDIEEVEEGLTIGESVPGLREVLATKVDPSINTDKYKPLFLILVAPGLPGCDDLIPAISELQPQLQEFEIVFVSMEPAVENQFEFVKRSGIHSPIILKNGWQIASLCKINSAPYAMIFDKKSILRSKSPIYNMQTVEKAIEDYFNNTR